MQRRTFLLTSAGWALTAHTTQNLAMLARDGGVLVVRHASTEQGLGDPAGFQLGQCKTQRNLSEAGRAEARAMGAWFKRHDLKPSAVLSSQWCRCQDTARLAFGGFEDWTALNSTFSGLGNLDQQLNALRKRLNNLTPGTLEVWVTHQVIMTGLTCAYPSMAEGCLVDAKGTLMGRGTMAAD